MPGGSSRGTAYSAPYPFPVDKGGMLGWLRAALLSAGAMACLVGCVATAPVPPTYTQADLQAACDRQRGWWRPDGLRGGYCDFRGP